LLAQGSRWMLCSCVSQTLPSQFHFCEIPILVQIFWHHRIIPQANEIDINL
jgi:hypothetical protein